MTQTLEDLRGEVTALFDREPQALEDEERYRVYRRLRHEAPVLAFDDMVVVSRYNDILSIVRDPETFSSQRGTGSLMKARASSLTATQADKLREILRFHAMSITEADNPEHARLRGLANYAFTPRRVSSMRGQIQELTDRLLEPADRRGTIELVSELCYPLPLQVILAMFGVPLEDAEDIRRWSDEMALAAGSVFADVDRAYDNLVAFREYVTRQIEERRGSTGHDDLLTALMAAEEDGSSLSTEELVVLFVRLLFAGHETTTNRIANSMVALLRHPDQLQLLKDDPSLMRSAIEELLRYRTSVQTLHRVATRGTDIGGVPVRAGQSVRLLLGSAHHDEEVFTEPERLDLRRENASRHIALGFGIHTCLGAWLQRLESEVAISTLLTRYPGLRLVSVGAARPNFIMSGPRSVHIDLY